VSTGRIATAPAPHYPAGRGRDVFARLRRVSAHPHLHSSARRAAAKARRAAKRRSRAPYAAFRTAPPPALTSKRLPAGRRRAYCSCPGERRCWESGVLCVSSETQFREARPAPSASGHIPW